MDPLGTYLPADRLRAIAQNIPLPERTEGSALFADISGSTPLAEALARLLGPRRGAEEVTRQLNSVYDVLIAEVDSHGGSIIGFAGDAITCWFDGDNGSLASSAALGMQSRMSTFAAMDVPGIGRMGLAMKASVATGPARRLVVGDPALQLIDVVAGDVVVRMATGEHLASKGDLIVDTVTAANLAGVATISEWRIEPNSGERFAVVTSMDAETTLLLRHGRSSVSVPQGLLKPWLLPPVYERLIAGQGEFLTELRPAISLFAKFGGIDFEHDEDSGAKLDRFIRWVSVVLARYDSAIIQLTIGDKGSFFYAGFGAPVAHENDNERALMSALDLQSLPPDLGFVKPLQIGISRGTMRIGAYGSTTRRTYGILGDEVNLSARLMEQAKPGQTVVSAPVYLAGTKGFLWERLPDVRVKGKSNLISIYRLLSKDERRSIRLQEPHYALPMVGREQELGTIRDRVELALEGRQQIVGITGEAGLGKSRLVAEAIGLCRRHGMMVFGGECQSHGVHTSYLVWRAIFRGLLGLDGSGSARELVEQAREGLRAVNPQLLSRFPLLGPVLNLSIEDNEVTRTLDAKLRKSALESLLLEFLSAQARAHPLLLVFEDCHWIDSLSAELIELVARSFQGLPVVLLLSYRPAEATHFPGIALRQHARFTCIQLVEFTLAEAERLIALKLEQLLGSRAAVPQALVERLTARTGGNPFYIEELLNYLQDQGINPSEIKAWDAVDLPHSLHSLILSRMDRLSENQKVAVKVASIIGRIFQAAVLLGIYPQLGEQEAVRQDLEELARLEVTTLERPEPELTYLFKHAVTQQVAYESLPFAMRSTLHEQAGLLLESRHQDSLRQFVDLLAFHFDRSQNSAKRLEYLLLAGDAARAAYANTAAIDYYNRALPLLDEHAKIGVLLNLGQVQELLGHWDESSKLYQEALELAKKANNALGQAECEATIGDLMQKRGHFAEAIDWLQRAGKLFEGASDRAGVARVLHVMGNIAGKQGDYAHALDTYSRSLEIRRELDDRPKIASLLSNLGIVRRFQSDYPAARVLYEESLEIRRALKDRWGIANSLNNLGLLMQQLGDSAAARLMLEESLGMNREIGDRWSIANCLTSLGGLTVRQGDLAAAREFLIESLRINQDLGDRRSIAFLLECFAQIAVAQGFGVRALTLAAAAAQLRLALGVPLSPAEQEELDSSLRKARESLDSSQVDAARAHGTAMSLQETVRFALG